MFPRVSAGENGVGSLANKRSFVQTLCRHELKADFVAFFHVETVVVETRHSY